MTPAVVFVESNTTGTGELFLRRALALGLAPTVLAAEPARYGFEAIDGMTVRRADTSHLEGLVEAVRGLARQPPVAVLSTSDYFVGVAAHVAERLGLASPGGDAVERCRDKARQHERLAGAGVRVPASRSAASLERALAAGRELGWPVVCKPAVGSGSVGVRLCAGEDELGDHARRLLRDSVNERGMAMKREVLVERFVAGDEYSVEIVGGRVQAVVRKYLGRPPHFVEIGHDYPAQLSSSELARLRDAATEAVRALDLERGPCHVEARIDAGDVWIIEVNPRLAGGRIPVLVRRCGGPDLIEATLRIALGEQAAAPVEPNRCGALRFVVATRPSIAGPVGPELVGDRGGVEAMMYVAAGTAIEPHRDFRDRVGHVLATRDSAKAAQEAAEDRAQRLARTLLPAPEARCAHDARAAPVGGAA